MLRGDQLSHPGQSLLFTFERTIIPTINRECAAISPARNRPQHPGMIGDHPAGQTAQLFKTFQRASSISIRLASSSVMWP